MDNFKRNYGSSTMMVWPWWKAKEAGMRKHTGTDATKTSSRNVPVLPVLPLEIVDIILREACEWPLSWPERQVLTACTLVCKSWLPLARRFLYHSLIVVASRTDLSRKPGTFRPEALLQQSHLLGLTRSLSIRFQGKSTATLPLSSEDEGPEGSQERVQIPDFFLPLAHTPRLRHLELFLLWEKAKTNIGPFEPHILDWLSGFRLILPVESLDLYDGGSRYPTFVYDLVGIWPTIRALRVVTLYNEPPPERPSLSLRELRLPFNYLATAIGVIEWLLPPPPPNEHSSLCFLELYDIRKEALPVLSVHGPSVSSLTLSCQPAFEFAHLFTKLEELIVMGTSWRSPLPAFPKTLKHIMLYHGSISGDEITQVVPMLPDLRILSIPNSLDHHPDLLEACKIRNVDLLVCFELRRPHPYHVEMGRFPRQYTFSEFFELKTLKGSSTL